MGLKRIMKKSVILGVLVLIALTACANQDRVNLEEEVFHGTEGLRMSFVPNVPEPVIYSSTGEIMDIAVELENQGTFPLQGDLYFSGHDPHIIGLYPGPHRFPTAGCTYPDILPRSKTNPYGGTCVAEFQVPIDLSTVSDSYNTNLLANVVYRYGTNAQVDFCIDPVPNRFKTSPQPCVMQSVGVGGGQGAPVAVTNVEANAIGRGQVLFRITVENVGTGLVVDTTVPPSQLRPTNTGVVGYRIAVPGGGSFGARFVNGASTGGFSMSGAGTLNLFFNDPDSGIYFNQFFRTNDAYNMDTVRLVNGRGVITQIIDYSFSDNAFVTPLQILLSYGYMQHVSIPIRIVNVDAYQTGDAYGRIVVNRPDGVQFVSDSRGNSFTTPTGGITIPR